MECPKCGYFMDSFDRECPRCAKLAAETPPAVVPVAPPSTDPAPPVDFPQEMAEMGATPISQTPLPLILGSAVIALVLGIGGVVLWQHFTDDEGAVLSDAAELGQEYEDAMDRPSLRPPAPVAAPPQPTPELQSRCVARWSGQTVKKTESFRVSAPWTFVYECSAGLFQVYLHDAQTGELVDLLANTVDAVRERSIVRKSGTFYFDVNALGPWQIEVWAVE